MSNADQWNAAVDAANWKRITARLERRGLPIALANPPEPKPGSLRPFKRAAALFTAIIECRAAHQNNLFELQQALGAFPPYVSRGHGWKGRIRNRQIGGAWSQDRSKYAPHVGKKELAKAAYRALPAHMRDEANRVTRQIMDEDRRELEVGL